MPGVLPFINEPLLFEQSVPGRTGVSVPNLIDRNADPMDRLPHTLRRAKPAPLPELSELEVVRHFTRLSQKNFSIDTLFYPLGSCTMKYNPKVNDAVANLAGFAGLHPMQDDAGDIQGMLRVFYECQRWLCEISGLDAFTLAPAAGANGEFAGMSIIRAYHDEHKTGRTTIIIPEAAHGTNPATAALCGFQVREIPSRADGCVDLDALRKAVDDKTAGLMLTNPNTFGVFEKDIKEIADIIHAAGGLVYYDGANLNAIVGRSRPGDMGYDVVHFNLHKTFSTPHGGGGPGSGPVGVRAHLEKYLPAPIVRERAATKPSSGAHYASHRDPFQGREYFLDYNRPSSIGRMQAFNGNTGVVLRAYTYMLMLGAEGIRRVATYATLNANYVRVRLQQRYPMAFKGLCKHEFIITLAEAARDHHVTAFNVAKRLLDKGFHSPTVYFPIVIRECLLIEPTETESLQTLDKFIDAMLEIADEIEREDPALLNAPTSLPMKKLDDVKAVKELNVCCRVV